jgi:hypothetical protein
MSQLVKTKRQANTLNNNMYTIIHVSTKMCFVHFVLFLYSDIRFYKIVYSFTTERCFLNVTTVYHRVKCTD